MDEQNAIERLRRGDISGLDVLVHKHQIRALRSAYLIVRDQQMAEDIVQSAFLRVYERIDQFDQDRSFEPWFIKIVINESLKATRGNNRFVSLDSEKRDRDITWKENLVENSLPLDEMIEESERQRIIWDALGQLSSSQRTTVILRYYLGMNASDISEELNRPPGTIRWVLHVAHNRLRGLLKQPLRLETSNHTVDPNKD